MENSPASERRAVDRSGGVRDSAHDDIRLDGEWNHQRVCEGAPGCRPVGTGRIFIRTPTSSLHAHQRSDDLPSWGMLLVG